MMAMNATSMMRLICARPSPRCADMTGAARSVVENSLWNWNSLVGAGGAAGRGWLADGWMEDARSNLTKTKEEMWFKLFRSLLEAFRGDDRVGEHLEGFLSARSARDVGDVGEPALSRL